MPILCLFYVYLIAFFHFSVPILIQFKSNSVQLQVSFYVKRKSVFNPFLLHFWHILDTFVTYSCAVHFSLNLVPLIFVNICRHFFHFKFVLQTKHTELKVKQLQLQNALERLRDFLPECSVLAL